MRLSINDLPDPEKNYNIVNDRRYICSDYNEDEYPKITIVTPSYNQGKYIESTIRCVLLQGYNNIEYIIIDGGSTDESVEIIKKYQQWIKYWVSEKDSGMYEAINKGFKQGTGEIMGWSPTGDLYEPGALYKIGNIFKQKKNINWLTSSYKITIDEKGNEISRYTVEGFNRDLFYKGVNSMTGSIDARYMIQQQSTFWRKYLWESAGAYVDESMRGAGDFELWSRFYKKEILYTAQFPIGIFRSHTGQESVKNRENMIQEIEMAFIKSGGKNMNMIERYIRNKIFRKRIFWWLRKISRSERIVKIVNWDEENKFANIEDKYIV